MTADVLPGDDGRVTCFSRRLKMWSIAAGDMQSPRLMDNECDCDESISGRCSDWKSEGQNMISAQNNVSPSEIE
jgi:hypothetical protein